MDTNRFKASHDFSNLQKNLQNNPGYSTESYSKQMKDYLHDMKNKNQAATKHEFMMHAQKSIKEVWGEIQEVPSEAWKKNKNILMRRNNF
ncbi:MULTISPECIES: prevent-host-death protein [unclassified Chryseobacterium]|uniref:prevent-host-death protein n=1 Tax=unclassified Chryseobacterium TaxID=2593645 RepID=UPI00100A89CF|nr:MULTISPECIES: prevent-host-death protein [unclassified Chryseobacterium]RXM50483.1 prevent-host-death protein [Chryseobacterium sp. CH25]RXM65011.1 prevent-host-death protein [Chryseobacterium sp. CH1]